MFWVCPLSVNPAPVLWRDPYVMASLRLVLGVDVQPGMARPGCGHCCIAWGGGGGQLCCAGMWPGALSR
jgi:hypothetical protein